MWSLYSSLQSRNKSSYTKLMDRKFLLFLKYYYTLASHTEMHFICGLLLAAPILSGIKHTSFKLTLGWQKKEYTDFCYVASNTNKGIPQVCVILRDSASFEIYALFPFPPPKKQNQGFTFIPHKHPSARAKTCTSSLTHSRPVFTRNSYHDLYSWQRTR